MKKILLSIFAVLFAFAGVQAQTTKTYTYDFSSNANWVTTEGGSTNVGTSFIINLQIFIIKEVVINLMLTVQVILILRAISCGVNLVNILNFQLI